MSCKHVHYLLDWAVCVAATISLSRVSSLSRMSECIKEGDFPPSLLPKNIRELACAYTA